MKIRKEGDSAWVYESPDNGKTVYRRPFGDIKNKELYWQSEEVKTTEQAVTKLADEISYKLLATNKHEDYEWLKQVLRDATVV